MLRRGLQYVHVIFAQLVNPSCSKAQYIFRTIRISHVKGYDIGHTEGTTPERYTLRGPVLGNLQYTDQDSI